MAESKHDRATVRQRRRDLLHQYYGLADEDQTASGGKPTDINGSSFNVDVFMDRLLQEKGMKDLLGLQRALDEEIKQLDNDMQHLVYENHSKFITASDTIRNMKSDFQSMEDRMKILADKMHEITVSSDSINSALSGRKQQISKLSGVHNLLKKLQFLFELPRRLKKCIEMQSYGQAVRYYSRARHLLDQYQHIQSFEGIRSDCNKIVKDLSATLQARLLKPKLSAEDIEETVELLLDLREPYEELCHHFLDNFKQKMNWELMTAVEADGGILQSVNMATSGYLSNMQGLVASFQKLFIQKQFQLEDQSQLSGRVESAKAELARFILSSLKDYVSKMEERFLSEAECLDSAQLVTALDKVYCKVQAIHLTVPGADVGSELNRVMKNVTRAHTEFHLEHMKQSFTESLSVVEQVLGGSQRPGSIELEVHTSNLVSAVKGGVEGSLQQLQAFIDPSIDFANQTDFREEFCIGLVRIGIVHRFLQHLMFTTVQYTEQPNRVPPTLHLTLSRFSYSLATNSACYLMSLADEKFPPSEFGLLQHTPSEGVVQQAMSAARSLLNAYVQMEGQLLSQMIRKSIETRDWMASPEPRHVRGAIRRVVEEVSIIDKHVDKLYEEGQKKEISDSSRPTYSYNTRSRGYPYSYSRGRSDAPYMSTNIQKLFSERIEVFGEIEFTKLSVVTGIIKIALKALLECVRLRTFGKFGLQQVQVDCHYLQMYLWTYVSDERIVREFVDEVISSAVHRSISSEFMEHSVVEVICEQN